jgi:hypothetical protein
MVVLFAVCVIAVCPPPYASKGYKMQEWGDVISQALNHAIVYQHPQIYPIFKVILIVLLIALFVFRNQVARLFSIYAGISYVLFAIGQSIAVTEKYGVAVCTIIIVMFFVVAAFWVWEAIALQNDFRPAKIPVWRYWVVPLLLFAFWCPLNWQTLMPDFNPAYVFTNGAGMAFCMMTPCLCGAADFILAESQYSNTAGYKSRRSHHRFVQHAPQFYCQAGHTLVERRLTYTFIDYICVWIDTFF